MDEYGSLQKITDLATLLFAVVFIGFGIGLLTRLIFPGEIFMGGSMRAILGSVVLGYGVVRIAMIGRRLRKLKRKKG